MSLNELINKRKKLLETMDGFLETHKTSNGTLSKEDDEVYLGMEKEFDELTASISRLQRREAMENEMNKAVNRPLTSKEFFEKVGQKIYISATPAEFELNTSQQLVEQIIRPTGLVDPKIHIRPIETQISDLKVEIRKRAEKK